MKVFKFIFANVNQCYVLLLVVCCCFFSFLSQIVRLFEKIDNEQTIQKMEATKHS